MGVAIHQRLTARERRQLHIQCRWPHHHVTCLICEYHMASPGVHEGKLDDPGYRVLHKTRHSTSRVHCISAMQLRTMFLLPHCQQQSWRDLFPEQLCMDVCQTVALPVACSCQCFQGIHSSDYYHPKVEGPAQAMSWPIRSAQYISVSCHAPV